MHGKVPERRNHVVSNNIPSLFNPGAQHVTTSSIFMFLKHFQLKRRLFKKGRKKRGEKNDNLIHIPKLTHSEAQDEIEQAEKECGNSGPER